MGVFGDPPGPYAALIKIRINPISPHLDNNNATPYGEILPMDHTRRCSTLTQNPPIIHIFHNIREFFRSPSGPSRHLGERKKNNIRESNEVFIEIFGLLDIKRRLFLLGVL